jgi:hypothetical protein
MGRKEAIKFAFYPPFLHSLSCVLGSPNKVGGQIQWRLLDLHFGGTCCLHLKPWRWRQYISPKRWYLLQVHMVSQPRWTTAAYSSMQVTIICSHLYSTVWDRWGATLKGKLVLVYWSMNQKRMITVDISSIHIYVMSALRPLACQCKFMVLNGEV